MIAQDRLYLELLFVGALLLVILLVNNIFLYKQKITDYISRMTIAGIVMCAFEIAWALVEGHPNLNAVAYITGCGYCISFVLFTAFLNRYLIDRFGIKINKIRLIICYVIPITAFALICTSTPWTHLVFKMTETGQVQEMILFGTLFYGLLFVYTFSPILLAIYFLTIGKKKRPKNGEIPASLFVFCIMTPILYWLEELILGEKLSNYENLSLPVSIALVYLVTNVSTHTVLKSRAKVEAIETDLRIASKIQTDALPPTTPEFDKYLNIDMKCCLNTAKEVGGDFYDYFFIDENRMCFLIADVSGKGTPAALFMMTAKTIIKDYALFKESTSEILNEANVRLCENNKESMFATVWIGILDIRTMTLQYTNAGHNYPILQRKGKGCEELETVHGLMLAAFENTQYDQSEIHLEKGDRLLLYTDGATEAHNKDNELYGVEKVEKMLEDTRDCSGEETLNKMVDDINSFAKGISQFDDITMVIISIKE